MLKKSFLIVLIQAAGMIVSLFSVYFVAGDMGPVVYSLIGIRQVVCGIVNVFSHLGVETVMCREALYWMRQGDTERVQEYATQSILSRLIGCGLLFPLVFTYLIYVAYAKYEGHYLLLFLLFYIGACIGAINQSMTLIIRSRGEYVFSEFVGALNGDIVGVVAILIYQYLGLNIYLLFIALGTLPVTFVYASHIFALFKRRYLNINQTIKKIKESRYLWTRSWLDYFKAEADVFLVSLLFPSAILGNYSIFKKFESIVKTFIEGFFDILSQRLVQFKSDKECLIREEKKINIVRWAAILIFVIGALVFSVNPVFFVQLINLQKYEGMQMIIYVVLLIGIMYLFGKYELNAIFYFAPTKTSLKFGVATFIITITSYISMVILPSLTGALIQRIIVWGTTSLLGIYLFRTRRDLYYSHSYQ